jgi:hypothetical protein
MPPAPCIPEKEVRNLKTTAQRKAAFLRALGDSGSIAKSARVAGIDRTTHYEWLAKDPRYRARFEGASAMRRDTVLDALMERAVFGVFKPIIYKGKFCREPRCRIICQLADGTSAFADELPKGARVMERVALSQPMTAPWRAFTGKMSALP